jgi:mannose-6-phosphate isomerase-like protein (cupin superfamily)
MSTYTRKNLRDVEDSAAKHGLGEGFAARFAREDLASEATGLSLQSLAPDATVPFAHRHENAEEIYVILAGSGQMLLGDETLAVAPYDAIRVSPGRGSCGPSPRVPMGLS